MNLYENEKLEKSLGESLRPGGYELTKRIAQRCGLAENSRVLDLGCGNGATLSYLKNRYKIEATGIDISDLLLEKCRKRSAEINFRKASGLEMPFEKQAFDCVLSECSLSLMEPKNKVIDQVHRVLKKKGFWGLTDLYAKRPENLTEFNSDGLNTCVKKLHNLEELTKLVQKSGFKVLVLEDESSYLKDLMIRLIFEYGSMEKFWQEFSGNEANSGCHCDFKNKLKACKPGYFLMILQKEV